MRRMFLYGILCGVMMAAAVTFFVAIPANNDHWRVEIVKRGGGTWYFDKNGHLGWMWTAEVLPKRARPVQIIVPQSRPKPVSSPKVIDTNKLLGEKLAFAAATALQHPCHLSAVVSEGGSMVVCTEFFFNRG